MTRRHSSISTCEDNDGRWLHRRGTVGKAGTAGLLAALAGAFLSRHPPWGTAARLPHHPAPPPRLRRSGRPCSPTFRKPSLFWKESRRAWSSSFRQAGIPSWVLVSLQKPRVYFQKVPLSFCLRHPPLPAWKFSDSPGPLKGQGLTPQRRDGDIG